MVKARTWFTLLMLSVGTLAATAGCGGDEATGAAGGAAGGALIDGGNGGKSGSVEAAGASNGSAGDSGSGPTVSGGLGGDCVSDSDCGASLTCVTPDSAAFGSGGPSLGMCTLACANDVDCTAVETGAACITFGTSTDAQAFCFERCVQGGDGTVIKCHNRPDFACRDFSDPTVTDVPDPFCVPQCRADTECGAGRFCNPQNGLCSKTKPTGDAPGTACDPNATTDNCLGTCIGVTASTGFCATLCSGFAACEFSSSKPGGLCRGELVSAAGFGPGDLGYCESNCECTADCTIPGDLCRAWAASESASKLSLGADGLCYPNATDSVELDCGANGAGGVAGAAN